MWDYNEQYQCNIYLLAIISISSFSGSPGSSYASDCLVVLNLVCLSSDHINSLRACGLRHHV